MKKDTFYSYRYFITSGPQTAFIKKQNQISKLIQMCKQSHLQKTLKGERIFGMVYIREIAASVHLLKFYKASTITKYEFDLYDDIAAVQDETLPFVFVVIDTNNQIVLMSKNTSVFPKERSGQLAFQSFVRALLNDENVVFSLEPIVENSEFWLLIDRADRVYKFRLSLRSPNLFGGYNSTDDFLKMVEEATSTDQVAVELESQNGSLIVAPQQFGDPLSYADGGGGDWSIELSFPGEPERVKIRSGSKIKTFTIPRPSEKEALFYGDDKRILDVINAAEDVLPKRQGDTKMEEEIDRLERE